MNPVLRRALAVAGLVGRIAAVAILLLWVGDWIGFQVRSAHGGGLKSVEVQEYLRTPLKGSKEEYDYVGSRMERCARALFPHAAAPPCWWLRRHTTQWE